MNKFTRFGAIVALILVSTVAKADFLEEGTPTTSGDQYFLLGYDTDPSDVADPTFGHYKKLLTVTAGNTPTISLDSSVMLGSTSMQSLFDSKANQSDLVTLSSTVSGLGSPFSGSYTDLTNKPSLFSGSYLDLSNKPTLFSGAYSDLTGKPSLFSGAYSDLTGKPTIPTVPTDDSSFTNGAGYAISAAVATTYATKASLATVATTGAYGDLSGKPTIPTNTNQLTNGSSFITASGAPVQSVNGQTGAVTITVPSNVPVIYSGTTVLTNPKIDLLSGSTNSSGLVVFQLTTDGTSTGTAIFSSAPAINIDINSSTALYAYSYAFTNSNKTLTVTVTSGTSVLSLGLLPTVAVASGVTVNARAFGN